MDSKTDLNDVTFLIPIRVDSIVRLENLIMVTDFIITHFDTNIHILEATSYNNNILGRLLSENVSVTYIKDYDPVFHRTKYINMLIKGCFTPFLAVWDADVIVPPEQIITSVNWLREKEASFVFPYKDKFLDTTHIIRELYFGTRNLEILEENKGKMEELYRPDPFGGGFFVEKATYKKLGMENEYFYGWGNEDADRINRWKVMGYIYKRVSGPLFHLSHERGMNSKFHTDEQGEIKFSEILRIFTMSKNELESEIKTWKH